MMNEHQTYHATQSGSYLNVCSGLVEQMSKIHDHTSVQELLELALMESWWYAVYHRRQYEHFTRLAEIERGL